MPTQQVQPLSVKGGLAWMARRALQLRTRFRVGTKFLLVLVLLVPSLLTVAWVGAAAQARMQAEADGMYEDNVLIIHQTSQIEARVSEAGRTTLQMIPVTRAERLAELRAKLYDRLVPQVDEQVAELRQHARQDHAEDSKEWQLTGRLVGDWRRFKAFLQSPEFVATAQGRIDEETNDRLSEQAVSALAAVATTIDAMQALHADEARAASDRIDRDDERTARDMLVIVALALTAAIGGVVWLIGNVVPRIRGYSQFAAEVAAGELAARLEPTGSDELAELGRALDELVTSHAERRDYEETQAEFVDTMQLSETESEAHNLLKRHLERSMGDTDVVVLNRNNSADRLEAMTEVRPDCPLTASLEGAKPRSCLAVRFGRVYRSGPGHEALLDCGVCSALPEAVTCEPLLVSGEVIGSVLVNHPDPPAEDATQRIRESVAQAAPVLANLRNLAIAEVRAATDALTGLPNNRAVQDTVKRMVAQASRSVMHLSAVMLDLDHFKRINDTYGHSRGDEVLAAVAQVLRSTLRASDFVGRYGGEEFIILLPDTARDEACIVAEKVRAAVAGISLSTIDLMVTASQGIATLPDDAGDADALIRAADRALYLAKRNGRNRVELSVSRDPEAPEAPEEAEPVEAGSLRSEAGSGVDGLA
jgi:diguanylate cyclase (GGDEF)-like protein